MHVETVDPSLTQDLRRRVLRPHFTADQPLPGDDVVGVLTFAALDDDDRVIGTCLAFAEPCDWRPERPAWRLRGMAVDPDLRGGGIGRAVLTAALSRTRAEGGAIAWCHARESAAGFWVSNHFRSRYDDGDDRLVYDEPETGVPHRDMWMPLA